MPSANSREREKYNFSVVVVVVIFVGGDSKEKPGSTSYATQLKLRSLS